MSSQMRNEKMITPVLLFVMVEIWRRACLTGHKHNKLSLNLMILYLQFRYCNYYYKFGIECSSMLPQTINQGFAEAISNGLFYAIVLCCKMINNF